MSFEMSGPSGDQKTGTSGVVCGEDEGDGSGSQLSVVRAERATVEAREMRGDPRSQGCIEEVAARGHDRGA
jgi:hypothetical protein